MKSGMSPEDENKTACAAMIWIGVGEIVGSLINGKLHDKIGTKSFVYICLLQAIIAYTCLIAYNCNDNFSMVFASGVTFLWGLSDACLTNFYLCVCGFQFDSKTLPYSVLRSV
jgi:predicted MFS family arabinose efflux permease